jgi:hypothetical protein
MEGPGRRTGVRFSASISSIDRHRRADAEHTVLLAQFNLWVIDLSGVVLCPGYHLPISYPFTARVYCFGQLC